MPGETTTRTPTEAWGPRKTTTKQTGVAILMSSHGAIEMLIVGTLILSIIGGGLAVTATFNQSSVSSDVNVQIERQFVIPQFDSINQSDIRTSSPGRQSTFRTQDGTTLRIIEENISSDSLTVTVPVENVGTNRRTARLSVDSSTTPFTIDTETISESFANNSTFAQTVNHTVISDTDALIELPPTAGNESRAINVTLSYDTTPTAPLTAIFEFAPTDSRVKIQPDDQLTNGDGNNGNNNNDDGGTGGDSGATDPFASGSQTVVTDGLKLINENGTDTDNLESISKSEVAVLGTAADIDGDSQGEQPFTNASGAIKTVEAVVNGTTVQKQNETTLVPLSSDITPSTSKSAMVTGQFDGGNQSIFFTNSNSDAIFRVNSSGNITKVVETGADALSAIGDIDGDSSNELVFADSSQNLKYLEPGPGGTVKSLGVSADSNNGVGIGVGQPINVDGDSAEEVVFVNSNNIKAIADDGGSAITLTQNGPAAKSPITTADVDRDGIEEIVFLGQSSGNINYVDDVGGANELKLVVNASGQPVSGSDETGLTSSA